MSDGAGIIGPMPTYRVVITADVAIDDATDEAWRDESTMDIVSDASMVVGSPETAMYVNATTPGAGVSTKIAEPALDRLRTHIEQLGATLVGGGAVISPLE